MKARNGKSKTHNQELAQERRRAEGDIRNAAWRALSPVQQLASIDARKLGATKQRRQLNTLLHPETAAA